MIDINHICESFSDRTGVCKHKAKLQIILHEYTIVEGGDVCQKDQTCYTCLGKHSFEFMKELPLSQSMRVSVYEMKEYSINKATYNRPIKIPAHDKISIDVAKKICFSGKHNSCKFLRTNNRELNTAFLIPPPVILEEGQSKLDVYIIRVQQRIIDLVALLNNCYGTKILMSNEAESIFEHLKLYEHQFQKKKIYMELKICILKNDPYDGVKDEYFEYLFERYSFWSESKIERKVKYKENNLIKLKTNIDMVRSKLQFILPHLNHKTAYSTECAICMEHIDNDLIGGQLQCKHAFHTNCIKKWFFKNLVCPVCRKNYTKNIHKYLEI